MDDLGRNDSDLSKFWLSYLELCELLLNLDFLYDHVTANCIWHVLKKLSQGHLHMIARIISSLFSLTCALYQSRCQRCKTHLKMVSFQCRCVIKTRLGETKLVKLWITQSTETEKREEDILDLVPIFLLHKDGC